MELVILAAVAKNGVIGWRNALPWSLPEDFARFRKLTLGHAIVMGRLTAQGIQRPLIGRQNIVVSTTIINGTVGFEYTGSFDDALRRVNKPDPVFAVGGTRIYEEALHIATRLLITEIHSEFQGDVFFPSFDRGMWTEVSREDKRPHSASKSGFDYSFVELRRRK